MVWHTILGSIRLLAVSVGTGSARAKRHPAGLENVKATAKKMRAALDGAMELAKERSTYFQRLGFEGCLQACGKVIGLNTARFQGQVRHWSPISNRLTSESSKPVRYVLSN